MVIEVTKKKMIELQALQQQCLEYEILEQKKTSLSPQQQQQSSNQQIEEIKQAIERKQQGIREIEGTIQALQEQEKEQYNQKTQVILQLETQVYELE